ncbi:hypothetical protein AOLI_G00164400 [Acnodon oligacanthus]
MPCNVRSYCKIVFACVVFPRGAAAVTRLKSASRPPSCMGCRFAERVTCELQCPVAGVGVGAASLSAVSPAGTLPDGAFAGSAEE